MLVGYRDASVAVFAGQQATGAIERQSITIARRFAMDADLTAGRYRVDTIFGYVAKIPVAVSMPNRALDKSKSRGESFYGARL